MVVDGSVVMVENILRHRRASTGPATKSFDETIATAAHEVQRPVFFAVVIIIIAYLPIFTLQRVEGRLFRPMAWTVAFALLGALLFSPCSSRRCWQLLLHARHATNGATRSSLAEPSATARARLVLRHPMAHRWARRLALGAHAIHGSAASSARSFCRISMKARSGCAARSRPAPARPRACESWHRRALRARRFPEVKQVVSQVGRPDDGTDASGFYNTEFFVDLQPRAQWRPQFHGKKDELIAAMDSELEKIPGVDWNFSQPISDNMEEAVSGVKGELAVKIFGADLKTLEAKADEIQT